jgi:hypothetical protein
MYKWYHRDPQIEQIWSYINKAGGKSAISALEHGLEHVFNTGIFDAIEQSWGLPSCKSGKLSICAQKCGAELDLFKEQFS